MSRFTLLLACLDLATPALAREPTAPTATPDAPLAILIEGEGAGAAIFLGHRGRERGTRVEVTNRFQMRAADCSWRKVSDGRFERARVRSLVPLERAGNPQRFANINATVLAAVVGAPDQRTISCFRTTLDKIAAGESPLR
jgi:hypothetical protein